MNKKNKTKKNPFSPKCTAFRIVGLIGLENYKKLQENGFLTISRNRVLKKQMKFQMKKEELEQTIVSLSTLLSQLAHQHNPVHPNCHSQSCK